MELATLYGQINSDFFENSLPPCQIEWSRRLTRTAGTIRVKKRLIRLSVPLLQDVWKDGAQFPVCGVVCKNAQTALVEILKHEMIHLWLHEKGLPSGHTPAFRAKARQIGQSKTRHGILLPPKNGWIYSCPKCGTEIHRRTHFRRAAACGACCKKHGIGKFDARFKLKGRRVVPS